MGQRPTWRHGDGTWSDPAQRAIAVAVAAATHRPRVPIVEPPIAPLIARSEYACTARWTFGGVNYAVATDVLYRASAWHDGAMLSDLPLSQVFSDGILTGSRIGLPIVDPPGGTYRTLVAGNDLAGTPVTVETVCTVYFVDGTSASQVVSQALTITDTAIEPTRVVLTLVDLDDDKLSTLYPSATYTTTDFPNVEAEGSGRPIAFPVGTALKQTCTLLERRASFYTDASAVTPQWLYGVCELEWTSLAIVGVNTGFNAFEVAGDQRAAINAGDALWVFDPANSHNVTNAGRYKVLSVSYELLSAGNTTIICDVAPSSGTITSSINYPPRVLAVYRNGRLVSSTEYTVEVLDNAADNFRTAAGDMSDAAEWSTTVGGIGTAAITGGVGALSGDGTTTNYGSLRHAPASADNAGRVPRRHQYMALRVDVAGSGAKVWAHLGTTTTLQAGSAVLLTEAAAQTFLVKQNAQIDDRRITFTTYSSGFSGSVSIDNLSIRTPTKPLLLLRFTAEQIDFDGSPYVIEADVFGYRSRNAVDEISRMLTVAGASVDSTTFAAAASYATQNQMLVDCDHGSLHASDAAQRRVRAVLDDLLLIARSSLYRTASGAYAITQDRAAAVVATLDEDAGDAIAVEGVERLARPASVSISYRPSSTDPSQLQHTVTQVVIGGTLAAESPKVVRYLRDHTAADRLLCYLARRRQYSRRMRAKQYLATRSLGDVLSVSSAANYPGALSWTVWGLKQAPASVEIDGVEYCDAIHTYTPNTLPTDAQTSYSPDYSQTPPAAPTALKITAGSTALAGDGTLTARVTVEAVPPSVNWSALWFYCTHNVTGEIPALVNGADIGAGKRGTTLTGLRPGEVYQLKAYALNAFNVQGTVQGTFDATAIGGGGTDTTFTAPGYATVPADVASCTAAQRMGRIIEVGWPAVSTTNLWGYVLERSVGGGSYAEVWRGQATGYRDTNVSIGTAYQYRVKARDTYGNLSTNYATSGSVTPAANVVGGTSGNDIPSNTVGSSNRTAVTTASASVAQPRFDWWLSDTITHSLGKTPMGIVQSSFSRAVVSVSARTTTDVTVAYAVCPTGTTASNPDTPHVHTLEYGAAAGATMTIAVDVW